MELKYISNDEPRLLALIQVFKNYYPDVIVGSIPNNQPNLFKTPDPEWMEKLLRVQANAAATSPLYQRDMLSNVDNMKFFKESQSNRFPVMQTLQATEVRINQSVYSSGIHASSVPLLT